MSVHAENTTPSRFLGRRAAGAALATVALVGVLAGCGGGTSTDASTGGSSSSSSDSKAPYTDAEACAWLKTSMPKVKDPMMAEAGLAMDLSTFFDQHGGLKNADGYAYDAATTRGCPELRAKALKAAELSSFGDI